MSTHYHARSLIKISIPLPWTGGTGSDTKCDESIQVVSHPFSLILLLLFHPLV